MSDPAPPLAELIGVRAGYGRIEVLHGVDLAVGAGEFLAILGPNGAGKTTLLNVLSCQKTPTSGHVHVGGRHINGADPGDIARLGICLIPEGRGVFPNLSVRDNLRVFSYAGCSIGDVEEQAFSRFPLLAKRRTQLAGSLSGGEQQMLALARALTTNPSVLLVDELSMGLAPMVVRNLFAEVRAVASDGVTVIVVEQFANLVLPIVDRVAVLARGEVAFTGAPADAQAAIKSAYLGSE
jgi:branched-chain amino acid transport system ATP-binding protein